MPTDRKQIPLRLPADTAARLEAVATVEGKSINQTAVDAIDARIAELRADPVFQRQLRDAMKRNEEALRLLAE